MATLIKQLIEEKCTGAKKSRKFYEGLRSTDRQARKAHREKAGACRAEKDKEECRRRIEIFSIGWVIIGNVQALNKRRLRRRWIRCSSNKYDGDIEFFFGNEMKSGFSIRKILTIRQKEVNNNKVLTSLLFVGVRAFW